MPYKREDLTDKRTTELKNILQKILAHKTHFESFAKLKTKHHANTRRVEQIQMKAKKDPEYKKYLYDKDDYKNKEGKIDPELLIEKILEAQNYKSFKKQPAIDYKEHIKKIDMYSGAMLKDEAIPMEEKIQEEIGKIQELNEEPKTPHVINEMGGVLKEMKKLEKEHPSEELKENIAETTELIKSKLHEQILEHPEDTKAKDVLERLSKKVHHVEHPVVLEPHEYTQRQKNTNEYLKQLHEERKNRATFPKRPKEIREMKQTEKEIRKEIEEEEKKEDHRKPYEAPHFESEQPNLRNEDVENAEFLNKNTDKDIGNVRAVGFLAPMEELAKEDDVVNHERSKSIRRFTNFKWVDSIQNSKLGYASPFQRMEDIDDRRRYGKCFMQTNKLPKVDTEEDVKKFETFNQYPLVPSFKLSGIAQPATEFSFKTSTNPNARKINIDEKQYGTKKLYNFECTDPRIKPYNPFASSYGMEPYDQARRNPNNVNNTLEFSSVMFNDDPFKRIKNKYQNKIVT